MDRTKTDNHVASKKAKLDLRQRVLAAVKPARVLDLFCGNGEMFRGAWHAADSYVGCDERPWDKSLPPRYVADNRRLMRALDLSAYTVFDLDAYGSPWDQMEILAARRTWKHGEVGAVVFTDGTSLKLRWGGMPKSLGRVAGVAGVAGVAHVDDLRSMALAKWVAMSKVKVIHFWQARGIAPAYVFYGALVFVGE